MSLRAVGPGKVTILVILLSFPGAIFSSFLPRVLAQQKSDSASRQPSPGQQNAQSIFPPGEGRETFLALCGVCHSPSNVLANGQTREGWEDTITKMAGYGATGTDEQFTEIVDYLAKNFPAPVNVNIATAPELQMELGLSDANANAIVQFRQAHGNFKSIDDLKKVPGLDGKKIDAERNRLIFQ